MTTATNSTETNKVYSEAQEARIQAVADENGGKFGNDVALSLADEFGLDVRSVRAKAARMGVYQRQERQSANGGKVETKEEIATEIGEILGANMDTLEKASKVQLAKLRNLVANLVAGE